MKDTYRNRLEIEAGHICILLSPGPWVLATGLPYSFGECLACLPTRNYDVPKSYPGQSGYTSFILDSLNPEFYSKVVGVIGGDILSEHETEFDFAAGRIAMRYRLESKLPGECVPIRMTASNIPIIDVAVTNQGTIPLIFNTGAQYSYLTEVIENDLEPVGKGLDYHPSLGTFEVKLFLKRIRIGSLECKLHFAVNSGVSEMCKNLGAKGILGWEVLKHGRAAYLPNLKELWI